MAVKTFIGSDSIAITTTIMNTGITCRTTCLTAHYVHGWCAHDVVTAASRCSAGLAPDDRNTRATRTAPDKSVFCDLAHTPKRFTHIISGPRQCAVRFTPPPRKMEVGLSW
jgi:hypothetical protein